MSWEQIAVGLQIAAIMAIVIGACVAPMLYNFWQNRNK